jgi:lipid-A-disaccharide synthase
MLGKPRVKVPYFAMVNLIAGEKIVPELVQGDFTAAKVVAQLQAIVSDGAARDRMLEGLMQVKAKLRVRESGGAAPVDRAAEMILGMVSSV